LSSDDVDNNNNNVKLEFDLPQRIDVEFSDESYATPGQWIFNQILGDDPTVQIHLHQNDKTWELLFMECFPQAFNILYMIDCTKFNTVQSFKGRIVHFSEGTWNSQHLIAFVDASSQDTIQFFDIYGNSKSESNV
jgi:hypothetical protein